MWTSLTITYIDYAERGAQNIMSWLLSRWSTSSRCRCSFLIKCIAVTTQ